MKATPKSCSCGTCRRGKASRRGNALLKLDERAYRHASKIALLKGREDLSPAPKGNYYD